LFILIHIVFSGIIVGVSESYKNVLNLTAGFWRNAVDSADILECNNAREFCIGGIQASNMLCADGHIGPLCEQCDLQGKNNNSFFKYKHKKYQIF